MQKKFTLKLTLFMIIGMMIIVGAVFYMQHTVCQSNNESVRKTALYQLMLKLESNEKAADDLRSTLDANAIAKARAFAEMIKLNPDIINSQKTMQEIADSLDVDEVHVTDENGVLLWGNIPDYYGFDFAEGDQTRPFLEILEDNSLEMAQEPQPNATTDMLFQYIGVSRMDEKGIVQVGLTPEVLSNALQNNAITKVLEQFTISEGSYLFAVDRDNGQILYHTNGTLVGNNYVDVGFSNSITEKDSPSSTGNVDGVKIIYSSIIVDDLTIGIAYDQSYVYYQRNSLTITFLIGLLVIFTLLIVAINLILKTDIIDGLNITITQLEEITGGNLEVTADVKSNKEFMALSESINNMVLSIKEGYYEIEKRADENKKIVGEKQEIFSEIKDISTNISDLSQQTFTMSYDINQGYAQQTDSIENVIITMNNLTAQAKSNAQISKNVSENAYQSSNLVLKVNESMDEMKHAIQEIENDSEKIRTIINNIDAIAEQTNLLAINAAIEAARAGEAGKGFAVVADQVSELSAQSAQAASETTHLIQETISTIKKGSGIVEKTSSEFNDITQNTRMVGQEIGDLVLIFEEQSDIVKEATKGVSAISVIAEENKNIALESETASKTLAEQAKRLKDLVQ